MTCIKRNIGTECLPEVQTTWQCCCCRPGLLQKLTLELERAMDCGKLVSSSDSSSDSSEEDGDDALRYFVIYYLGFIFKVVASLVLLYPLGFYFWKRVCFYLP